MKFVLNSMVLFGMLFITACTYHKLEKPVAPCILPADVSFKGDIIPVFEKNCYGSGCHSGTPLGGNLNLEALSAYNSLTKKGSGYVDTISPESSLLYSAMNSVSNPMPPTGELDKCSLDLILKWMRQKARNN